MYCELDVLLIRQMIQAWELNVLYIIYRLFVILFDNYNMAFQKTNSSGKTLDTRQKVFCAPLSVGMGSEAVGLIPKP